MTAGEIDPSLDKYCDHTPFLEKLEMAKEVLQTGRFPKRNLIFTREKLEHEKE